jgi:hypothetical protein
MVLTEWMLSVMVDVVGPYHRKGSVEWLKW